MRAEGAEAATTHGWRLLVGCQGLQTQLFVIILSHPVASWHRGEKEEEWTVFSWKRTLRNISVSGRKVLQIQVLCGAVRDTQERQRSMWGQGEGQQASILVCCQSDWWVRGKGRVMFCLLCWWTVWRMRSGRELRGPWCLLMALPSVARVGSCGAWRSEGRREQRKNTCVNQSEDRNYFSTSKYM